MAEPHVFEYGCTFGTLGKLGLMLKTSMLKLQGGVKNHVFDHETRKSGLFPCYRLKMNYFLSSYNQNLKIEIFTPLQQIPCYCKSRLGTLIIINLIYIAQFDTNGILTALYIVITYIQMQYVHVCTYAEQSYKYTYTCLHIHTYTVTCTNIHLPTY